MNESDWGRICVVSGRESGRFSAVHADLFASQTFASHKFDNRRSKKFATHPLGSFLWMQCNAMHSSTRDEDFYHSRSTDSMQCSALFSSPPSNFNEFRCGNRIEEVANLIKIPIERHTIKIVEVFLLRTCVCATFRIYSYRKMSLNTSKWSINFKKKFIGWFFNPTHTYYCTIYG